jgi:hypothetical protein
VLTDLVSSGRSLVAYPGMSDVPVKGRELGVHGVIAPGPVVDVDAGVFEAVQFARMLEPRHQARSCIILLLGKLSTTFALTRRRIVRACSSTPQPPIKDARDPPPSGASLRGVAGNSSESRVVPQRTQLNR